MRNLEFSAESTVRSFCFTDTLNSYINVMFCAFWINNFFNYLRTVIHVYNIINFCYSGHKVLLVYLCMRTSLWLEIPQCYVQQTCGAGQILLFSRRLHPKIAKNLEKRTLNGVDVRSILHTHGFLMHNLLLSVTRIESACADKRVCLSCAVSLSMQVKLGKALRSA